MEKNTQYLIIFLIALGVILFAILPNYRSEFNYKLPEFNLNSSVERDIALVDQAQEIAQSEWFSDAFLIGLTMMDGTEPLSQGAPQRFVLFGSNETLLRYAVVFDLDNNNIQEENREISFQESGEIDLSGDSFKVSSADAFKKAAKRNKNMKASPDDFISVNLTLIKDTTSRLVWTYLLVVQVPSESTEIENQKGSILFVSIDARSGRVLEEQIENI